MSLLLKAVCIAVVAALVAGWCTAAVLVHTGLQSSATGMRRLAQVALLAGALTAVPALAGGVLGGLVARAALARRRAESLAIWCFKGAAVGSALGCGVMLVSAALMGARPPWLGLFGLPGVVAGALAGSVVGAWASRIPPAGAARR